LSFSISAQQKNFLGFSVISDLLVIWISGPPDFPDVPAFRLFWLFTGHSGHCKQKKEERGSASPIVKEIV
jgi:hypothetical protein